MENISVGFECKNMLESDNAFHVDGYASVYGNVDLGGDIMDHGSFAESVGKSIPLLLSHDAGAVPIGTIDEMREDNVGLFFKASMPKSDKRVSEQIYPQLKHGSLKGVSVGFIAKAREFMEVEGKRIRKITKADLLEISLTAIGMNPKALLTDVK